jgi:hypothetical protein
LATLPPVTPDDSPAGLSSVALVGLLVLAIGALAAVGAWLLNWYRTEHPEDGEPPASGATDDGAPPPADVEPPPDVEPPTTPA